jgi:hypothetical protein
MAITTVVMAIEVKIKILFYFFYKEVSVQRKLGWNI